MTTDAEKIAAGLTPAQRRAVLSGVAVGPGMWQLRNALARKGIATSCPFRFTPLGLAVRSILEKEQSK